MVYNATLPPALRALPSEPGFHENINTSINGNGERLVADPRVSNRLETPQKLISELMPLVSSTADVNMRKALSHMYYVLSLNLKNAEDKVTLFNKDFSASKALLYSINLNPCQESITALAEVMKSKDTINITDGGVKYTLNRLDLLALAYVSIIENNHAQSLNTQQSSKNVENLNRVSHELLHSMQENVPAIQVDRRLIKKEDLVKNSRHFSDAENSTLKEKLRTQQQLSFQDAFKLAEYSEADNIHFKLNDISYHFTRKELLLLAIMDFYAQMNIGSMSSTQLNTARKIVQELKKHFDASDFISLLPWKLVNIHNIAKMISNKKYECYYIEPQNVTYLTSLKKQLNAHFPDEQSLPRNFFKFRVLNDDLQKKLLNSTPVNETLIHGLTCQKIAKVPQTESLTTAPLSVAYGFE